MYLNGKKKSFFFSFKVWVICWTISVTLRVLGLAFLRTTIIFTNIAMPIDMVPTCILVGIRFEPIIHWKRNWAVILRIRTNSHNFYFISKMHPTFNLSIKKISYKTKTPIKPLFTPTVLITNSILFEIVHISSREDVKGWSQLKNPPEVWLFSHFEAYILFLTNLRNELFFFFWNRNNSLFF